MMRTTNPVACYIREVVVRLIPVKSMVKVFVRINRRAGTDVARGASRRVRLRTEIHNARHDLTAHLVQRIFRGVIRPLSIQSNYGVDFTAKGMAVPFRRRDVVRNSRS